MSVVQRAYPRICLLLCESKKCLVRPSEIFNKIS